MPRHWPLPRHWIRALAPLLTVAAGMPAAHADEGMWTYDNFPSATVREDRKSVV